jgi:hypothetical protein
MSRKGSCHCGEVKVTIDEPPVNVTECNCSLCRRTGALRAHASPKDVHVEGNADGYRQGDEALTLSRCKCCRIATHWTPTDPDYDRMGINLRLFDPVLWASLPRVYVDGASW